MLKPLNSLRGMIMSDDKWNLEYNAYSALYHCVKGLITTKGKLAHKIVSTIPDQNDRNLEIKNEDRLRKKLFAEIQHRYNKRINFHELKTGLFLFPDSKIHDMDIIKFNLISSDEEEEEMNYSGKYIIYPKTFICSKCDDFVTVYNTWDKFNPNKCRNKGCDGFYEQMSIVLYCEDCGRVKELSVYNCKEHPNAHTRLKREERDALITWKAICPECQRMGKPPVRIFDISSCNHYDSKLGKSISSKKSKKFQPLTIKEGGIFTPVVLTCVDIPKTEHVELENLEYLMLGLHLGNFKTMSEDLDEIDLYTIEDLLEGYNNQTMKKRRFRSSEYAQLSPELKEKKWKEEFYIDFINQVIENLRSEFEGIDLETLNDYFALSGFFSDDTEVIMSFEEHINSKNDKDRSEMFKKFEKLKTEIGLEDIKYLSSMTLISCCIGIIKGINKFYEDEFVPHFDIIWKKNPNEKYNSYAYPFETEGLIIDLDKVKVCNWLIENEFLDHNIIKDYDVAKNILLKIETNSPEYEALKTLLHTLSHILINRASVYTGLDSDSCSEIIFTNQASILIYSTSNINIGGFSYIFENYLFDWFKDVKMDISDCTFDPTCIFENGACFSCLYLPEYVCTEFNHYLDRNVFLGTEPRHKKGYW